MKCDRRQFLTLMATSAGTLLTPSCARKLAPTNPATLTRLNMGSSLILIMIPIAYLLEKSQFPDGFPELNLTHIRNHEQIKALLTSGQVQLTPTPTLIAAGLYQQAVPIQLLNVMEWGNIYLLSPAATLRTWADLRGKTVVIPFKGSLPEMLFRFLATQQGLDPDTDLTLQSTQDFQSTAQLLLAGRADAGVFAEPQASQVVARGQQNQLEIHYALSFRDTWQQTTGREPRFPQAGLSVSQDLMTHHPEAVDLLQRELQTALDWTTANPQEAAILGAQYMDMPASVIQQALTRTRFEYVPAQAAQPDLESLFEALMQMNPQLLQGTLPDANFYAAAR
jgi:NitT/TauT family transport system substrate-binding protein